MISWEKKEFSGKGICLSEEESNETATENQKRDWIGKKHADEFEIVTV